MNPDNALILKNSYLTFRLKMLELGQNLSEEDIITEQRLTVHLGNLFRIWAKQAEKIYDDQYSSGDDAPKAPEDGPTGPIPTK